MKMRFLVVIFILFNITFVSSQITISNNSCEKIEICFAYYQNDSWIAEGWWTIEPEKEITFNNIPINKSRRNLFYYARSKPVPHKHVWCGKKTTFCISYDAFTIPDSPNCYDKLYFRSAENAGSGKSEISLSLICPCHKDLPNTLNKEFSKESLIKILDRF